MSGERAIDGGLAAELARATAALDALAYIIVFESGSPRRIYVMSRQVIVVGRDDDAELQVGDGSVSAQHARITSRGQGFEIEDLGSTNGTTVGGSRVNRALLHNGDRVKVGTTELMFLLERPTSATVRLPDVSIAALPGLITPRGLVAHQVSHQLSHPPRAIPRRNQDDDDDELSLVDVVRRAARIYDVIRNQARMIIIVAAIGASLGVLSILPFPPGVTVTGEVKLLPRVSLLPNQTQDRWGASDEGSMAFVRTAEKALTHPELMRAALLKVERTNPSDARIGAALQKLKVEEVSDHQFKVTYQQKSSKGGAPGDLLAALIQGYAQGEIDRALRESRGKVDFLREQVKSAEKDLDRISQERASFRSLNVDRLPEEASQTQSSRYELESRRSGLVARARQLESELGAEQAQLKADRPGAQTRFQWSESYRTSLAEVNRKLSEALSRGLKDAHPEVIRLKDERERLQALAKEELQTAPSALVRESDPRYQQVQRNAERLRAELSSTRASLSETDRALGKVRQVVQDLPRVEQRVTDLNHRQEATKQLHSELFAKMKQAEIQLNLDKVSAESRYEIGPTFEDRPRILRVAATRVTLGLFAGLFVAAMALAYQEMRKAVSRALAVSAHSQQTTTLVRPGRSGGSRP